MAKALMIDLETLAVGTARPLIISAAILAFETDRTEPVEDHQAITHVIYPSITEQVFLGRHVTDETLAFWRGRPPAVRAKAGFCLGPAAARVRLFSFFRTLCDIANGWGDPGTPPAPAETFWSNGAADDLVWLETLARDLIGSGLLDTDTSPQLIPWRYNQKRCYRTIRDFPHRLTLIKADPNKVHDPAHDVAVQAANTQIIFANLAGKGV